LEAVSLTREKRKEKKKKKKKKKKEFSFSRGRVSLVFLFFSFFFYLFSSPQACSTPLLFGEFFSEQIYNASRLLIGRSALNG
jgi:hypothetical protein